MLQELEVASNAGTHRAEVLQVYPEDSLLLVERSGDCEERISATLAIPWSDGVCPGASVLLTADANGQWYVVGLLAAPRSATARELRLRCGLHAVTEADTEQSETLRVFSPTGNLLFEYRGDQQQTRIHLPSGDVQFVAHDGRLEFVADEGISMHTAADVQIGGQAGVNLSASSGETPGSSLNLSRHEALIASQHTSVVTEHLDVDALESQVIGRTFVGRFLRTRVVAETLETIGGSLVQKVKNMFQTVKGLSQQRSGSVHTVADESLYLKAGDVVVKSDRDVKVKGEQIHLA